MSRKQTRVSRQDIQAPNTTAYNSVSGVAP